ncbi:hypothetical protein DVA81_18210, partial [Acinetobacter baumannii]
CVDLGGCCIIKIMAVLAQKVLLLNTEQRVRILMTMWYFSLINLQKFLHFCFFLSRWGADCTLMRNKMNFFDFSKWLQ